MTDRCVSPKSELSLFCDVTDTWSPSSKSMSHALRALVDPNSLYTAAFEERIKPSELVVPKWKDNGCIFSVSSSSSEQNSYILSAIVRLRYHLNFRLQLSSDSAKSYTCKLTNWWEISRRDGNVTQRRITVREITWLATCLIQACFESVRGTDVHFDRFEERMASESSQSDLQFSHCNRNHVRISQRFELKMQRRININYAPVLELSGG